MTSAIYVALLREGSLASQMLSLGATHLRKAGSRAGLFYSALFELSIGFERLGKIIVIEDFFIRSNGKFPTDADLRKLHHDIATLYHVVVNIAKRWSSQDVRYQEPNDPIHSAIIRALSDFAKLTRYHNLDSVVQGKSVNMPSPEEVWFNQIGEKLTQKHYSPRRKAADKACASSIGRTFGSAASVIQFGHDGKLIDNLGDAVFQGQRDEIILKHAQFYILQIIRFFTQTLMDTQSKAHSLGGEDIPYLSEYFWVFYNDDKYFKERKSWIA